MRLRYVGLILMIISIMLFSSNLAITGAVIGIPVKNFFNFFGAICFVLGFLILSYSARSSGTDATVLEEVVNVYDDGKDKKNSKRNKGEHYFMTDPLGAFGNKGTVSLNEFRQEIKNEDEDYVGVISDGYKRSLTELANDGGRKSEIARAFLEVLDPNYHDSPQKDSDLSKEERRELQLAFRNYDGNFRSLPKAIIGKYGFTFDIEGKHAKIRQRGSDFHVVAPISPSDWRGGRNLASEIIGMIEKNRRKHRPTG